MSNYTYDYPLSHKVELGTAQAAVTVPGQTARQNRVLINDAFGIVGSSPAAMVISVGDGTTPALYGTINVAAGGTAGNSADITLNLTEPAAYEIIDLERLVFTNTTAPANAIVGLTVSIGYF